MSGRQNTGKYSQITSVRLFVAGIPSRVGAANVQEYFEQFGPVRVVVQGQLTSPLMKGCCVLETPCSQTLSRILSLFHLFRGRNLQVSEYREGVDLIRYNQNLNRRRVVVKKIPKSWREEEVTQFLEIHFGPVQSLYKYKAQSPSSQASREQRQTSQTFSAVFYNKEDAQAAAAAHKLKTHDGLTIVLEKFCRKAGGNSEGSEPVSPTISSNTKISNTDSHCRTKEVAQKHQKAKGKDSSISEGPSTKVAGEKRLETFSGEDCPLETREISVHQVKPTQAKYLRPDNYQVILSNLRFNKGSAIQREVNTLVTNSPVLQ